MRTEYGIINEALHDFTNEDYAYIFKAHTMEEVNTELVRIGADDEHYCIEEYRVDEDGEYYGGSDYDTPSNFKKRTAAARSVKEICRLAGMTQTAVANRFHIPQRTFGNWCTGVNECPEYTRLMMQELLGIYRR